MLINVNEASLDDLCEIPGVGPVVATKILSARNVKKLTCLEDLATIKGVGPAKISKMEKIVSFSGESVDVPVRVAKVKKVKVAAEATATESVPEVAEAAEGAAENSSTLAAEA